MKKIKIFSGIQQMDLDVTVNHFIYNKKVIDIISNAIGEYDKYRHFITVVYEE